MDEKIISRDALPDNRPEAQRQKDFSTQEIASAGAPEEAFKNDRPRKFSIAEFNQWYVGSCVPHGFITQLVYEGVVTEEQAKGMFLRAYRKRFNYPSAGSNGVDMFSQIKSGQSTDFPTPEKFREAMATAMPYVLGEKLIKDFSYFLYQDKKTYKWLIDDIPADIAAGKAVSIFIYATEEEWEKEYVEVIEENYPLNGDSEVRHCVCLVPKGDFTKDGKRWLTVQDSAKFGKRGMRYVEFDSFLKSRLYFAAKVYATGNVPTPPPHTVDKPVNPCLLGDQSDHVRNLQAFLVKEGKLEAQYVTGYYGALTAKAVLWWQLEHWNSFTSTIPQLLEWSGQYWGQQSINIINK
jgi:hypothetical protein